MMNEILCYICKQNANMGKQATIQRTNIYREDREINNQLGNCNNKL